MQNFNLSQFFNKFKTYSFETNLEGKKNLVMENLTRQQPKPPENEQEEAPKAPQPLNQEDPEYPQYLKYAQYQQFQQMQNQKNLTMMQHGAKPQENTEDGGEGQEGQKNQNNSGGQNQGGNPSKPNLNPNQNLNRPNILQPNLPNLPNPPIGQSPFGQNQPQILQPMPFINTMNQNKTLSASLKMNNIISMDRAIFIKDLMELPSDMKDLLQSQKIIDKNQQETHAQHKELPKNVDLKEIASLLEKNGKEAIGKLVIAMGNAAKYGVTDLSDIKDTMRVINSSVSLAGMNNPAQVMKSVMMLYLPWLPLQEGVGFDLEIETTAQDQQTLDECSLLIFISTKNYGNIKVSLTLSIPNEVNALINCSNEFPQKELLKIIQVQTKDYSMQSSVVFEPGRSVSQNSDKPQAKISMVDNSSISPFLLLMANLVIRHTIELDSTMAKNE